MSRIKLRLQVALAFVVCAAAIFIMYQRSKKESGIDYRAAAAAARSSAEIANLSANAQGGLMKSSGQQAVPKEVMEATKAAERAASSRTADKESVL